MSCKGGGEKENRKTQEDRDLSLLFFWMFFADFSSFYDACFDFLSLQCTCGSQQTKKNVKGERNSSLGLG
jgi:hypothetical protein